MSIKAVSGYFVSKMCQKGPKNLLNYLPESYMIRWDNYALWFIDVISSNHFDNNKANVKYIFGFRSHQDPKIGQIIPRVPKMTPILELIMINTNDLGVGVRRVFLGAILKSCLLPV